MMKNKEVELELATFHMSSMAKFSYDTLEFLCKIWDISHQTFLMYKEMDLKEEIIIRVRAKMRAYENRRRLLRRHFPIKTPKKLR
jgi:hypothetical protein